MNTGIIFNIQRYAIHDGPGIRTTVFFKGCPLRCWWCHNPESLRLEPETVKKSHVVCDGVEVTEEEVFGKVMDVSEVVREIEKEVLFFDESGGGVTISGGEPMMQADFLSDLLTQCKKRDLHVALDTSGYTTAEMLQAILPNVDLFLYDLKLMDSNAHRTYTGVSNQKILDNLLMLSEQRKPIFIRVPVIPGITDTRENIVQMREFLATLNGESIRQINLLPYHRIAEGKYALLHKENKMAGVQSPTDEQMRALQQEFQQHGFLTKIGG